MDLSASSMKQTNKKLRRGKEILTGKEESSELTPLVNEEGNFSRLYYHMWFHLHIDRVL